MSRSRKKNPVFKQKNDAFYKRYSNKKYRKLPLELTGVKSNRMVSSYDICDWTCRSLYFNEHPEDIKRALRK